MALATFQPSNLRLEAWEPCIPGPARLSRSKLMTPAVMSYQYPLLSSEQAALDVPNPGYSLDFDQTHQDMQAISMDGRNTSRAPLNGITDATLSSRRSFSTPTSSIRQEDTPEQGVHPGTPGEKKRTKLGYHRTSIACSHCRRRKIRCVTSPDVPNKCTNCIRLKKVCSFCPVDQQTTAETRPKMPSRASSGPKTTSGSSPTSTTETNAADGASFSDSMVLPGISSTDDGHSPQTKEEPSVEPLAGQTYNPGNTSMAEWMPGTVNANDIVDQNDSSTTWRQYPTEAHVGAHFSSYTQAPVGPPAWAPGQPDTVTREDVNWVAFPPPVRSVTFGGGALNSQQNLSYLPHTHSSTNPRGTAGFTNIYPQLGTGAEASSANVLASSNGVPVAMAPSDHSSWRHHQAGGINSHVPHSSIADTYDHWGYTNGGAEHVMQASEQRLSGSNVAHHGQVYYAPDV